MKRHRYPTEMQDEVKIYCKKLRQRGQSLHQIAMRIERDHSTVVYNLKTYDDLNDSDKTFRQKVAQFNEAEFEKEIEKYLLKKWKN